MNMEGIKAKWLQMVANANMMGVPIPVLRDPKTGQGSVSLTLLFISFNIWALSMIGKIAGDLGGMNPDQCLNMFIACSGLYFGRKFQKDGSAVKLVESANEEPKNENQ